MILRRRWIAASLAFAAIACARQQDLVIGDASYRPPLGASSVGVIYMSLTSPADDAVIAIRSPRAERMEVHETMMSGDMASMKPKAELDLPAGKMVELKPGGAHIMVFSPQPLGGAEEFPFTLEFRSGKRLDVRAHVMNDR